MQNSPASNSEEDPTPSDQAEPPAATAATVTDDLTDELARVEDRYKRALADLDNYRKRAAREVEQRVAEAREAMLRDWLEAVDSVERAIRMQSDPACRDGLQAVLAQMSATLARQGAHRLGASGEEFDPERHEAIAVQPSEDVPDRTVLTVERSGYALGDRVIRPAQVVVARAPEPAR
jgi:molecular chaperone GrpE